MAIRLATTGDLTTYSDYANLAYRPMTVNDLIIDAHEIAATNQVFINMPSDFASFRNGGNIWIKEDASGEPYWGVKITGNNTQWGGSSPVHIKPIGSVTFDKDRRNTNSYMFLIEDCNYVWVDGVDEVDGLYGHWRSDFNGSNTYGFNFSKSDKAKHSTNALQIAGKTNGVVVRNCKLADHFSKIRINPDDQNDAASGERVLDYCVVAHNYVCDTGGNGEGSYILTTTEADTTVSAKKYIYRDNIISFAGAEGIQLQDIAYDSTFTNIIEHNQFYAPAQDALNPFQPSQASGMQTRLIGDNFKAWKNIFDGGFNNTWNYKLRTGHNQADFDASRKIDIRLNYFGRGGNRAFYVNFASSPSRLRIKNNYFDEFTNDYSRYSANAGAEVNTLIEFAAAQNAEISDNFYENSRTLITGSGAGDLDNVEDINNTSSTISAPQYTNLGEVPEPAMCWNFHWFQGIDNTSNNVLEGEMVTLGWFPRLCTVDTGTDTLTLSTDIERFVDDDIIWVEEQQSGGTVPGGLNNNGLYYVVNASGADFQLSTTEGGVAITLTTTGTPDWHCIRLNDTNYGKRYIAQNDVATLSESNWPPHDTTNFTEATSLPMNFSISDSDFAKLGIGSLSTQTPRTVYDWYRADNAAMTTNKRLVRRTFEPTLNTAEPEIETGYYYAAEVKGGYNGTGVIGTGVLVS